MTVLVAYNNFYNNFFKTDSIEVFYWEKVDTVVAINVCKWLGKGF